MSEASEKVIRKALDGGVLIALAVGAPTISKLKKQILKEEIQPFCSELAVTEMEYILCRRLGWTIAEEKKRHLIESRVINVVETEALMSEAAKIKCERTLSLPDCFTLALAKIFECKALFFKKEDEMEKEIKRKSFPIEIEFLLH